MKEKGFTLIELLAVIVILAIIALIATPIILNIIKDSKEESNKRSVDMYAKAIQNAIAKDQLDGSIGVVGSFSTSTLEEKLKVEYEGNVACDVIEIYADGTMYLEKCKVNSKTIEYTYGKKASFADDSWETIAKNVKAGYMYNIGDTKEVSLTSFINKEKANETTYTVRVANNTTPSECSIEGFSQTACGFVIEFVDLITSYIMNPAIEGYTTGSNIGGWEKSSMREYINGVIYKSLPKEIKEIIIDTFVVSGHGVTDKTNFITIDKLYLLSTKEVWGEEIESEEYIIKNETAAAETRQLDYYNNKNVVLRDCEKIIKNYNGYPHSWWLRSAYANHNHYFHFVSGKGSWDFQYAIDDKKVAPAFRIG